MIVFVDFDGTLHNEKSYNVDLFTEPNYEIVNLIKSYKKEGHTIVIYSCRSNKLICTEKSEELMINWLKKYDVPYDRIESNKPYFDILIDDRTINPKEYKDFENICWGLIKE